MVWLLTMNARNRILLSAAIAFAALIAWLPTADTVSHGHVDSAFKRALVGYALARGLNGVISVAQGTEVALQPAGVGVNFTPGEILDPINDLVERFSWIMMLATSSLGVQKILLSMSAWHGLLIGLTLVGLLIIASVYWLRSPYWRQVLQRVFLFLLLLRFMMPAISIANDWVYRNFLEADYAAASAELDQARVAISKINEEVQEERTREEPEGLIERARDVYRAVKSSIDIDARLEEYKVAAESISENTLRLIVVFMMQTLVFPLIFLFIMLGLLRRLTRW